MRFDTKGITSLVSDTIILYDDNPFVDSLLDPRDGQVYNIARINGYWIMTENLRYGTMLPDKNEYHPGVQGLCPPGWHIPEISEWQDALRI